MTAFLLRRVAQMVVVLWGAITLSFALVHLVPGDPVRIMLGGGSGETAASASPEQEAALRSQLGLDQPLLLQYLGFLRRVLTGDLGQSYSTGQPVTASIGAGLGSTVQLGGTAILAAVLLGLLFALAGVLLPGRAVRSVVQSVTVLGVAVPSFWLAVVLIQVFSFTLGWFPAFGSNGVQSLVLPALTLALVTAGTIAQLLTRGLTDALGEPYADTARSKGLGRSRIVLGHALRNASIPVLTMVGMMVGGILSGAVIVETVYGRPGIGRLFVEGVRAHDFPLIQALIILTGGLFVVVTLLVDLAYRWVDPRIRTGVPA
ncbi:ABC transporter permease [Cellulomonas sp. RIT-PI-Y]|jgi:peptide/nickel transport system permease protein|uniref:ABC transporter permease n=1 Tax=Cellulomonas sp. RIT-PI-Y TaxID=3035297 RepID=UPI0021D860DE|nr:ABC transporter permease [Cellulomonas sp. RIT-PI-Y]